MGIFENVKSEILSDKKNVWLNFLCLRHRAMPPVFVLLNVCLGKSKVCFFLSILWRAKGRHARAG